MSDRKFKQGDIIRCTNPDLLFAVKGECYEVKDIGESFGIPLAWIIGSDGDLTWYREDAFELASPPQRQLQKGDWVLMPPVSDHFHFSGGEVTRVVDVDSRGDLYLRQKDPTDFYSAGIAYSAASDPTARPMPKLLEPLTQEQARALRPGARLVCIEDGCPEGDLVLGQEYRFDGLNFLGNALVDGRTGGRWVFHFALLEDGPVPQPEEPQEPEVEEEEEEETKAPETIYVVLDEDGDPTDEVFQKLEDIDMDEGEDLRVAVYVLQDVGQVTLSRDFQSEG